MAKKKNTSNWIKRIIVMLVFGAFLGYFFSILVQNDTAFLVNNSPLEDEMWFHIMCGGIVAISLYFFNVYGIFCANVPFPRLTALILGIALIIISMYLPNDGKQGIFLGDLVSVLGVFSTILFPTNVLVTDKSKEEKQKKEEEIIEA